MAPHRHARSLELRLTRITENSGQWRDTPDVGVTSMIRCETSNIAEIPDLTNLSVFYVHFKETG